MRRNNLPPVTDPLRQKLEEELLRVEADFVENSIRLAQEVVLIQKRRLFDRLTIKDPPLGQRSVIAGNVRIAPQNAASHMTLAGARVELEVDAGVLYANAEHAVRVLFSPGAGVPRASETGRRMWRVSPRDVTRPPVLPSWLFLVPGFFSSLTNRLAQNNFSLAAVNPEQGR